MKSIRKRISGLWPENEKARSPKIVRSLGGMYREVEAERRRACTSIMVSNELHSITDVRRTAASVDEMHYQAQLEANAADVDRLRCFHEDADSIPYVQQCSAHAEE